MYEYSATVKKVVDGDTIDVSADLGFDIWYNVRLRINGVNAPEKNTEEGKAAKQFVVDYLPVGTPVTINTFKDKAEKYGRILANVRKQGEEQTLNELLLSSGHAVPYFGGPR